MSYDKNGKPITYGPHAVPPQGASELKAMLERFEVDFYHPHRVMTRDEYDIMKISGLHSVCHDWDGFGNTAIWMRSNAELSGRRSRSD
jgi:hypothetical protein